MKRRLISVLLAVILVTGTALPAGEYLVRVRSAAQPAAAHFDGDALLTFAEPVRAPAPGQAAVFYREGMVLASAYIQSAE